MNLVVKIIYAYFVVILSTNSYANVVDEIQETENNSAEVAKEKILKISFSKRVFILSNDSNSLDKGDFVSVLKDGNLIFRAIVAKSIGARSGVKALKIYSLPNWNALKEGDEIEVIRGDDSLYKNKADPKEKNTIADDLLKEEKLINEELDLGENSKRKLKMDNIISLNYGRFGGINTDGSSQSYGQFSGAWAYQVIDNFWLEASYGQNTINSFPSENLDTIVRNFTFRAKYTIAAPLDLFIKPYLGFQYVFPDSPLAGQQDSSSSYNQDDLNKELQYVDELKKRSLIIGVTLLKRIVPAWFIRGDLGTDIYGIGVSLEF